MNCERSTTQAERRRVRREILCADVDRWSGDHGLWSGESDAGSAARDSLCAAVRAAVETALTEKQREVVEAYFFEGLSQGEIARRLGITQQVVQKRLFGAPRDGRLIGGALLRLRGALEPLFAPRPRVEAGAPALPR